MRAAVSTAARRYACSSICLCFLCFSHGSYSASFELNIYLRGERGEGGKQGSYEIEFDRDGNAHVVEDGGSVEHLIVGQRGYCGVDIIFLSKQTHKRQYFEPILNTKHYTGVILRQSQGTIQDTNLSIIG